VTRWIAAAVFIACVTAGTLLDPGGATTSPVSSILVADLHIHPYPGDGSLPVWELQREAARRGIDVLAITGHNNLAGLEIGRLVPLDPEGPIVLRGQEITTPAFHLLAVGIERLVDWRLSARDAIAAIHAQGGVAIAAHPLPASWRDRDREALRTLDGAEVAHRSRLEESPSRISVERFFSRVKSVNPDVAPIGSTDFHMTAPLGLCRTYLLAGERSAAGALDAIRRGRTVAGDPNGRLYGRPEDVAVVERYLAGAAPVADVSPVEKLAALGALLSLAALTLSRPRKNAGLNGKW
jgi:hypothetical protein